MDSHGLHSTNAKQSLHKQCKKYLKNSRSDQAGDGRTIAPAKYTTVCSLQGVNYCAIFNRQGASLIALIFSVFKMFPPKGPKCGLGSR